MLKTIAGLQGVAILSKEAQKKVHGGSTQGCGIVLYNSAGNAVSGWYVGDDNGNGRTKDDAIAQRNRINAKGGYYHATYCCDGCAAAFA